MGVEGNTEFLLAFGSVSEFEKSLDRQAQGTGMFLQSKRMVDAGERVWIRVTIQGLPHQLFLEGQVSWKRMRAAGPNLPAGTYVALTDSTRARLDSMIKYLKIGNRSEPRRRHPRYPINIKARYRTNKGEVEAETSNVSKEGAFLRCHGPLLNIGSEFEMTLYLEGDEKKAVSVKAKVAWFDLFDETKGMGVWFGSSHGALKRLAKLIAKFEAELQALRAPNS